MKTFTNIPVCNCGVGHAPAHLHSPLCPLSYLVYGKVDQEKHDIYGKPFKEIVRQIPPNKDDK